MIDLPAAQQGPAPAACEGGPCVSGLSAVAVFAVAAGHQAAGRLDEAELLLRALTKDPNPEYRAEARFRLGKLLERRGDRAAAVAAYRTLLDERPGATRVRLDLARLLALQGDERGARRELRTAGTSGLPEDVARVVDQFAATLRSRRPLGGSFELAIAPDTNINASTRQRTIETIVSDLPLSRDARATSGVGLSLAGQAFARLAVAGRPVLTTLSARADLYRQSRFNDVSVTLASGPELVFDRLRVRAAAVVGGRRYGGARYSESVGATVSLLRPLGPTAQIEVEATALGSDYRVEEQDGATYDGSVAYDRALSRRLSARLGARITRQDARDPGYATTSVTAQFLLARQWPRRTGFLQLGLSGTEADARLFIFPERREDRRADVTAGLVARDVRLFGASPVLRVTHTRSRSSIALYDFRRTRAEFALSREF